MRKMIYQTKPTTHNFGQQFAHEVNAKNGRTEEFARFLRDYTYT